MMKGLGTRVRTALLILPPVLFILYWGGAALVALALLVFFQINREFFSLVPLFSRIRRSVIVFAVSLLPIGFLVWSWEGLLGGALLAILVLVAAEVVTVERETHYNFTLQPLGTQMLGLVYTGGLGTLLVVMASTRNPSEITWLMLGVIAADTGAYFAGSLIGGRKLAPRISPKKTISGLAGGLILAIVAGSVGAQYFLVDIGIVQGGLLGLAVGTLAVLGDLAESLVKRIYEVKDAGSLLPGHGGLLDRVDGLIFALPVLFFI